MQTNTQNNIKNVVILGGGSAGFIEPLESTGLHLIQSAISRLMAFFPNSEFNQVDIDEFNTQSKLEMEQIRDFIILHYKLTDREDIEFWRYCKHMDVPQGVTDKLSLYTSNGRIFRKDNELFDETSWLAVIHGQGAHANAYHPIVDNLPETEIARRLQHIQQVIETSVSTMPMQSNFIQVHCQSDL
ncbi:tryptophan 7-halogenase [Agaribacter marinus]|uniref:Tryptophan halogenase n=1 Tax=Agaribacter marinus TaxID=1431249 RepID=A0AA37T1G6_9ALTE|nr:tryptophan 7-halogenase [Agaribacter marinus]GLR71801.1 hypothetical protein GCM10007852_27090 [Agaribacter marinus]